MSKLFPLDKLKKLIQNEKLKGKKIVLANGCFDIIHIGHIRYLKEAKEKGDILVVAINSDKSVKKLKGNIRPLLNEKERAEILSSFYFVDYVTVFNENNVGKVLLELKPDIHCKGGDYTEETVPEKEIVKSYGGKVMIVGGDKIKSSSEIIGKIKKLSN
ncbi:MAG: D-glycero-beta-D-manno-heptose 1-phosphate adenylyltransferase [Acidobacteriota bacterium]